MSDNGTPDNEKLGQPISGPDDRTATPQPVEQAQGLGRPMGMSFRVGIKARSRLLKVRRSRANRPKLPDSYFEAPAPDPNATIKPGFTYPWPDEPIRAQDVSVWALIEIRLLVVISAIGTIIFYAWLLQPEHVGDPWVFWALVFANLLLTQRWIHEWFNYWKLKVDPHKPIKRGNLKVDVFTTACPGEPKGMIINTLRAMVAMRYPHNNFLCDEGNDPELIEACRQLGVIHVTRRIKTNAKAGNINNALKRSRADLVVILDPDHEPSPYMLERTVGYFEDDPGLAFVQSVQPYKNQAESWVARGAAELSYLFYGPMMIGMNGWGTVQAIGANCVFRREALDSIGGHAPGLVEDMHTSLCLYGKGWRGMYVPEMLTRGLVPNTLSAFFKQQIKWSCGAFELMFREFPKHFAGLTWPQRFHYGLAPVEYIRGLITFMFIAIPVFSLLTGRIGWRVSVIDYLLVFGPVVLLVVITRLVAMRWVLEPHERGLHLRGGFLAIGTWWIYTRGLICAAFNIKIPYIPTPKDDKPRNAVLISLPNILLALGGVLGIVYGLDADYTPFSILMACMAGWGAAALLICVIHGQQKFLADVTQATDVPEWVNRRTSRVRVLSWQAYERLLRRIGFMGIFFAVIMLAGFYFYRTSYIAGINNPIFRPFVLAMSGVPDTGGFYVGVQASDEMNASPTQTLSRARSVLGANVRMAGVRANWPNVPNDALRELVSRGVVPVLIWDPPEVEGRQVIAEISRGEADEELAAIGRQLARLNGPVMVVFGAFADDPKSAWGRTDGFTAADYQAALIRVRDRIKGQAAFNTGFVFAPGTLLGVRTYDPGPDGSDWMGISMLDAGRLTFTQIYRPWREEMEPPTRPVMMLGGDTTMPITQAWLNDMVRSTSFEYKEIRAVLMTPGLAGVESTVTGSSAAQWPQQGTTTLAGTFDQPNLENRLAVDPADFEISVLDVPVSAQRRSSQIRSEQIVDPSTGEQTRRWVWRGIDQQTGRETHMRIRGVEFNRQGDWDYTTQPPTRQQLEFDFAKVRGMGANTILRYGRSIYDHNVFGVANDSGIQVFHGLKLDDNIDYANETGAMDRIERKVLSEVAALRRETALTAWVLGDGTWDRLAQRYSQPYLTQVRLGYIRFVERLASRIREIDRDRPIFLTCRTGADLAGELATAGRFVKTVDAIGLNVARYGVTHGVYVDQLKTYVPDRPFLLMGVTPKLWRDSAFNWIASTGRPVFASQLAPQYLTDWTRLTSDTNVCLGGVAGAWVEKYDDDDLDFGLVDRDGVLKPGYFQLRNAWLRTQVPNYPKLTSLDVIRRPLEPGQMVPVISTYTAIDPHKLFFTSRLTQDGNVLDNRFLQQLGPGQLMLKAPDVPGDYDLWVGVGNYFGKDEAVVRFRVRDPGAESGGPQ